MIFHSTSKKPVLIVGNGVRAAGAKSLLDDLYHKTRIPVLTTMNAVDLTQGDNQLGFIGVYGHRVANMIVSNSDLVIAVGARLGLRQIGNKKEFFAPHASLIRADIDEYELSRNVKPNEEKFLIDAKSFLEQLLLEDIPSYEEWNNSCFHAKELLAPYDRDLGNACIERISALLPENPVVAVDIGQNQCWAAQSLSLKGTKGRIIIGGSYGSMGCGLPYAIGASIALGKKPVFCITGDGGLQMNIQELQMVLSERLPIKIFVINNRSLGKISEIQAGSFDGRFLITTEASGYSVPDFKRIAEAYGIRAATINGPESLDDIASWLGDDASFLININLPEARILQPKMNWNQREMTPLLGGSVIAEAEFVLREGTSYDGC